MCGGGGNIIPWSTLQCEYQLTAKEVFRYLQVRSALRSKLLPGTTIPEFSPLEARLFFEHMSKKAISLTYKKLLNNIPDLLQMLRNNWATNLGEITDDDWTEAIASPREVGIRAGFRLVQLKVLHRTYFSPTVIARMGRNTSTLCRRRCEATGTFYHVLWECPAVSFYWSRVVECTTKVTGQTVDIDPKICLLNIWGVTDLSRSDRLWATLGYSVAKRNIARLWGAENPPLFKEWQRDMDWCMLAEKVTYKIRGCPRKWSKIWDKWNNFRGGLVETLSTPVGQP